VRDAVVLNAGIALSLTTPDVGDSHDAWLAGVRAGMDRAEAALDSGAATEVLERWAQTSQSAGL
jgi:anthranilate phosphoribosyltransferase